MVVSRNGYLSLVEMQENALYIHAWLTSYGWSTNAVAGMLGNMQTESTVNPGIWQNLNPVPSNGFGLVQWTPSTKYTDWLALTYPTLIPSDINGQLLRIEHEVNNYLQWLATPEYPFSFQEFKTSSYSPEYLADAFLKCYERPANQNQPDRQAQARYWYNFLLSSGIQAAHHPFDYIDISQGENGNFSHKGTLCIDYVGPTNRYAYYTPCDMYCIYQDFYNGVRIWRTVDPVLCADGQIRHFTMSAIHDDIDWLSPSLEYPYIFPKGNLMGFTGVQGFATGDHAHFQVIEGTSFNGFYVNSEGSTSLVGTELHQYDVFYLKEDTTMVWGAGYPWKYGGIVPPPVPKRSNALIQLWRSGVIKL